jgi:hypothetical protein
MCGNNMSVPLLAEAVTVSATEKETAAVSRKTSRLPHVPPRAHIPGPPPQGPNPRALSAIHVDAVWGYRVF